jgi:hypothetical protein
MVLGVSTIARRRLNRKTAADRGWDAIVIGEYERAFYGESVRVDGAATRALWHPAVVSGGRRPVGRSEDDEQLMLALGLRSKLIGYRHQALPGKE